MNDQAVSLSKEAQDIIKGEVGSAIADAIKGMQERAANANREAANEDREAKKASTRKAAEMALVVARAKLEGRDGALKFAREAGFATAEKALGEATGSAGGYLVQPQFGEHIEALSAKSTVRELGANVMPMPQGNLVFPADGATGATANWVGENANAGTSQPSLRQVSLSAKQLRVIIPLSNQLLADTSGKALAFVERKAQKAAELAEDAAFLEGTGTVFQPKGLYSHCASANKFDITHAGATATFSEIVADLGKALYKLAAGNVPMAQCGWVFHPRIEWKLKTVANSLGIREFADEMARGQLFGFPFRTTTQLSIVLNKSGSGALDETRIYLADFSSCYIGEAGGVEMDAVKFAAYHDGSSVVSGLSMDQTAVVFSRRLDFGVGQSGAEVAVIEAVDWA